MNIPKHLSYLDAILLLTAKSEVMYKRALTLTLRANLKDAEDFNTEAVREREDVLTLLAEERNTLRELSGIIHDNASKATDNIYEDYEATFTAVVECASLIVSTAGLKVWDGSITARDAARAAVAASFLDAVEEGDPFLFVIRDF